MEQDVHQAMINHWVQQARAWDNDRYANIIASRYRYQVAFYASFVLVGLLIIAIISMQPLKSTQYVLLHKGPTGFVWAEPLRQPGKVSDQVTLESDLVRYITLRESYHRQGFREQYQQVQRLSAPTVSKQYVSEQHPKNKTSFLHQYGLEGYRSIRVDSIIFLDNVKDSSGQPLSLLVNDNLAEVHLTINEFIAEQFTQKDITILVSWKYSGSPKDLEEKWKNPFGFTITRYEIVNHTRDI